MTEAAPTRRPGAAGNGRWWVIGILATLVFLVVVTWRVLSTADQQITVTTTGFQVDDDRQTTIAFTVHKHPDQRVVCTVQAQDLKKNVVGSAQVTAPPGPDRDVALTVPIRTTTKAYAAIVYSCVRS